MDKIYSKAVQGRNVGMSTVGKLLRQPSSDTGILCPLCGKASVHRQEYFGHINKHLGLQPFQCHICYMTYGYQASLFNHLKRKHRWTYFFMITWIYFNLFSQWLRDTYTPTLLSLVPQLHVQQIMFVVLNIFFSVWIYI